MHLLLLQTLASAPPGTPRIAVPFPHTPGGMTSVKMALSIVFGIAGGVALVIIVLSGLRLVTSGGDPQALAKARNTILYALIGLVVCIAAITIVSFTANKLL